MYCPAGRHILLNYKGSWVREGAVVQGHRCKNFADRWPLRVISEFGPSSAAVSALLSVVLRCLGVLASQDQLIRWVACLSFRRVMSIMIRVCSFTFPWFLGPGWRVFWDWVQANLGTSVYDMWSVTGCLVQKSLFVCLFVIQKIFGDKNPRKNYDLPVKLTKKNANSVSIFGRPHAMLRSTWN